MSERAEPQQQIAAWSGDGSGESLPELCLRLHAGQVRTWSLLAESTMALASVWERAVAVDGGTVNVVFNPGRINSTTAVTDPDAVARRPCFLCRSNRPPEQEWVLYLDEWEILCNPYPIFPRHLTVVHREHRPQESRAVFGILPSLARRLSPLWSVFFNGPLSGASAPDHLHLQAVPWAALPVETDDPAVWNRKTVHERDGAALSFGTHAGRTVLVLEGAEEGPLAAVLAEVAEALERVPPAPGTPMMNLLCRFREGRWSFFLFPRRRGRPEAYFREGADRILVSPGTVEMAGTVVTPREEDFLKLNAAALREIYRDVSAAAGSMESVLAAFREAYVSRISCAGSQLREE
jgi:diadenosine tetraphosphate (Ap4A) HIT family hydrolase